LYCRSRTSHHVTKVIVKKEPASPSQLSAPRHRPRHLDLSSHDITSIGAGALSGRPMTAKDTTLGMQDVLSACLSPGFNTSDPAVQQQLQRSMSVRDQQRMIIEARQKGQKVPGEGDPPKSVADPLFKPNRNTSRRKGPPPMLSIAPASHAQFANERVIQSAPLNASFTGLRQHPDAPLSRHIVNQHSNLAHGSHVHHTPAIQTSNRLPPIADVFPSELQSNGQTRSSGYNLSPGHSTHPPLPSPGYPPAFHQQHKAQQAHQPTQPPQSARSRDFTSADEAVRSMTGGRDELLPRLVHYGGAQPPTPPSPGPPKSHGLGVSHANSGEAQLSHAPPASQRYSLVNMPNGARRRDRDEYENDNGSPPLGPGPLPRRQQNGPFGGDVRDSPETIAAKKERFMHLMEEAWDLFHS
jgi:hypothetical protein